MAWKKRALEVNGMPTEVTELLPEGLGGGLRLVVVPGNPGIVDFYVAFMEALFAHHGQEVPVMAVSHAGHTSCLHVDEAVEDAGIYSLDEQVAHKVAFLELCTAEHRARAPDAEPLRFVLLGHSVGSYVALQVRKQRPDLPIVAVGNLFPTFQYLHEGLAPAVRLLVQPGLRTLFASAVHVVPQAVKRYMVRQYSNNLDDHAQQVVADGMARYASTANVLYMARTESCQIRETDHELIEPVLDSLFFLYGREDRYTPLEQYHGLREMYPDGRIHLADEGLMHAFCVDPMQSKEVARFVAEELQRMGVDGLPALVELHADGKGSGDAKSDGEEQQ